MSCSPKTLQGPKGAIRDMLGVELVSNHDQYLRLSASMARVKKEIFKYLVDRVAWI